MHLTITLCPLKDFLLRETNKSLNVLETLDLKES